jgi:putative membrane protein
MKAATLLRKLSLADGDLASVKNAVADAERATTGEIAVAITEESSDYSFFELFASVILGAITFAAVLAFHGPLADFVGRLFWGERDWYVTAASGFVAFAVMGLGFAVANVPAVDRLVAPRAVRHARSHNRALKAFIETGVYATAERTGILIFISRMEREVCVVADSGINAKIPQEKWDSIASGLALGIKSRETGAALVRAIGECGTLLAENFPAKRENPNELKDGIIILEAGE